MNAQPQIQTPPPNTVGNAQQIFDLALDAAKYGKRDVSDYLFNKAVEAESGGSWGTADFYVPGLDSRVGNMRDMSSVFWKSMAKNALKPEPTPSRYNETLDMLGFYDGIKNPEDVTGLTFRFLDSLTKNPTVYTIISTRQFQVTRYARVQNPVTGQGGRDNAPGFRVRQVDDRAPVTPAVRKQIEEVQDLLLHGGYHLDHKGDPRTHDITGEPGVWDGAQEEVALPFDQLLSVLVKQVLSLDFAPLRMEQGADHKRAPVAWFGPVDATRIRRTLPHQYRPQVDHSLASVSYVELAPMGDPRVIREFDWARMDALMLNPRLDYLGKGYGFSPLEVALDVLAVQHLGWKFVKSWYDESAPQSIVTMSGQPTVMAQQTIELLKMQMEMGSGAKNWNKVLFIPFPSGPNSVPNPLNVLPLRQMTGSTGEVQMVLGQMTQNISLLTACFGMHPEEIGWSGVTESKPTLNGEDPTAKLQHSQEKGLYPLMERIAAFLNRNIVQRIAPHLIFEWVNLEPKEAQNPEHVQILMQSGFTPNQLNDMNDVPRVNVPLEPQLMRDVRSKVKPHTFGTDDDYEDAINTRYERECKKLGVVAWSAYPDLPIGSPEAMQIVMSEMAQNNQIKQAAQQAQMGQNPMGADPNAMNALGGPQGQMMPGQEGQMAPQEQQSPESTQMPHEALAPGLYSQGAPQGAQNPNMGAPQGAY